MKKNTNISISDWLNYATANIKSESPRLDAELLLSHHLGKNRAYLLAFADEFLPNELLPILTDKVKLLATGYPLAYLLGKKSFWDMELTVTEDTLIPRADTETIIEICEKILPIDFNGNVLDLGTGSGAIAIALSRLFTKATITATDKSRKALSVAKLNADDWQIAPINFACADWFPPLDNNCADEVFPNNGFDVIISNPPYIEENDIHLKSLSYEPITALTAADNGLADIKTIIEQASNYLKNNGYLLLEHGYNQGNSIRDYFSTFPHWQNIQTMQDLGGNDRVTMAKYIAL